MTKEYGYFGTNHVLLETSNLCMKLSFASKTDIGLVREVNQDRWVHVYRDWGHLFVVADGLGHREGGQFASQTTVDFFKKKFCEKDPGGIPDFFKNTFTEVNRIIYEQKINKYEKAMMGSTCVVLVIKEPNAYIAHVGDSRAYYLHNDELMQLTKDHSLVQKMVDDGMISQEQAKTHPNKNVLTEAVGAQLEVNPDITLEPIAITSGDRFLLCSDGLWGMVTQNDLYKILNREEPDVATKKFIELANQNGGYDNITIQVIHIT